MSGQLGTPRMPTIGARITIPDVYVDTSRGRIMHRQVTQWAAKQTLGWHHRIVMREHFKQTNRAKYGHMKRTSQTKRQKRRRWRSITDLVKSGRSKDKFLSNEPRVSFHSKAPEGIVHAYMRYQWPFRQSRTQVARGVTLRQMNDEVTRWTDTDIARSAKVFAREWAKEYRKKILGRKKLTKIITPQL